VKNSESVITVLLVDDQRFIGMAVSRLLATEPDITLHCCYSANEAIAQANQVTPDVIFQDLQMPDIDGLTLVGLFRSNAATATTPIIVLSGNDDAASRERAAAAGANDYLVKLPTKSVLLDCIRQHGNPSSATTAPSPEPQTVQASVPENDANADVTLDSTTIAGIRSSFAGGGAELAIKLIDQFVKESSTLVTRLAQAAMRGDEAGLKAASHNLKGTSLTMGANRLARLSGDIEMHVIKRPGVAIDPAAIQALVEELGRVRAACAHERGMTSVGAGH